MSHARQVSKQRRTRKAMPVLGAAGLSLSLAGGASAAVGGLGPDMLMRNAGVSHEITLAEEEICDVSLATFHVFDQENPRTSAPRARLVLGACAGCGGGCGGCGCSTGNNYDASVFGSNPQYHSIKPAPRHAHASRRTQVPKKP